MIVLEVSDEAAISYYEVLGLAPEEGKALEPSQYKKKIRRAADNLALEYTRKANAGDREAHERMTLINTAGQNLLDEEKRKKHDEELASGRGAALEILRPQPIAPPFFSDRDARFRAIERLLREAGWSLPIALDLEGVPAQGDS